MYKSEKADATNIGSKNQYDYFVDNQSAFSDFDYAELEQDLQENVLSMVKPPKVIRLFKCFGCGKSYSAKKMSNFLAVCRECFTAATAQDRGKIARRNFIERTLNNLQKFLRRHIAS